MSKRRQGGLKPRCSPDIVISGAVVFPEAADVPERANRKRRGPGGVVRRGRGSEGCQGTWEALICPNLNSGCGSPEPNGPGHCWNAPSDSWSKRAACELVPQSEGNRASGIAVSGQSVS